MGEAVEEGSWACEVCLPLTSEVQQKSQALQRAVSAVEAASLVESMPTEAEANLARHFAGSSLATRQTHTKAVVPLSARQMIAEQNRMMVLEAEGAATSYSNT